MSLLQPQSIASALPITDAERAALVRVCAHLCGDAQTAEDLAQETLLIAWRLRDRLRDRAAMGAWLTAIARNVHHRWQRAHHREQRIFVQPASSATPEAVLHDIADPLDLEIELERAELATLLDRALALLPEDTRAMLVQTYIDESPHAEIAARLGLTENALAVRLHRGKLAFKQVLHTHLRAEAKPYGLAEPVVAARTTRIWCPICGIHRLIGGLERASGLLQLRCPACCPDDQTFLWHTQNAPPPGMTHLRKILEWNMTTTFAVEQPLAAQGSAACPTCGSAIFVQYELPFAIKSPYSTHRGLDISCTDCGGSTISLRMFVQTSPEVRAFWQRYPRMRTLPEREIVVDNEAALLIGFESVDGTARIEAVVEPQRYTIRKVVGTP